MYLKEITRDVLNLPSIKAGERGGWRKGGEGSRRRRRRKPTKGKGKR